MDYQIIAMYLFIGTIFVILICLLYYCKAVVRGERQIEAAEAVRDMARYQNKYYEYVNKVEFGDYPITSRILHQTNETISDILAHGNLDLTRVRVRKISDEINMYEFIDELRKIENKNGKLLSIWKQQKEVCVKVFKIKHPLLYRIDKYKRILLLFILSKLIDILKNKRKIDKLVLRKEEEKTSELSNNLCIN